MNFSVIHPINTILEFHLKSTLFCFVLFKVLDGSFFLNESVSRATEINLPENRQARQELRELCRLTADDGVSLIAVEKLTGKPIAVAFNKIQVKIWAAKKI